MLLTYLLVLVLEHYSVDLAVCDFFSRCAWSGLYVPSALGVLAMLVTGLFVRGGPQMKTIVKVILFARFRCGYLVSMDRLLL